MANTEKSQTSGFQRGLSIVYNTRTAAEYAHCMEACRIVCTTTEARGNSRSSFYNKRYGRTPLSVTETKRIAAIFAQYGVTDWEGPDTESEAIEAMAQHIADILAHHGVYDCEGPKSEPETAENKAV